MELSQSDVASLIPMNQFNYSKIERDIQEPNFEQLHHICQILQLDPSYLLDLDDVECVMVKDRQLLRQIKNIINDCK